MSSSMVNFDGVRQAELSKDEAITSIARLHRTLVSEGCEPLALADELPVGASFSEVVHDFLVCGHRGCGGRAGFPDQMQEDAI